MSRMFQFGGAIIAIAVAGPSAFGQLTANQRALLERPPGPHSLAAQFLSSDQIIAECDDLLRDGGPATADQRRAALLLRAEAHWRAGKLDRAEADVDACLRLAPNDPLAVRYQAHLRFDRTGDSDPALAYQKAHPEDCWANLIAAYCTYRVNPKEAMGFAKRARELAAEDTEECALALTAVARAAFDLDLRESEAAADDAIRRIGFATRAGDVSGLYLLRAAIRTKQGRSAAAAAEAEAAVRANPRDVEAFVVLFGCQIADGRPEAAYFVAQQIRERFKDDQRGLLLYATACNLTGRSKDVLALRDDPALSLHKGLAHLLLGDEEKAATILMSGWREDPSAPFCPLAYDLLVASARSKDLAAEAAGLEVKPTTKARGALLMAALLAARAGRFDEAERHVDELLKLPQVTPLYTADLKILKARYSKRETAQPANAIAAVTALFPVD
jgi:tetratricopeptide (TPR) repeat protein